MVAKRSLSTWLALFAIILFFAVGCQEDRKTASKGSSTAQVVCVHAATPDGEMVGSGFVVAPGYVLSSGHGVKLAGRFEVQFEDGSTQEASLLATSAELDLSLLKIPPGKINGLSFSVVPVEKVGESVTAVGCPLGLNHSISQGRISGPERRLQGRALTQIDVPVNPGNSGGPLLNGNGEIVGVVIGVLPEARGIAFAVPGREARRFLGESFQQMGILLAEKKRYPDATEALERSVGFWPGSAKAYSNLGEVYRRTKAVGPAEKALIQSIAIDSGYAVAHYNLGLLYDGDLHDGAKAAFHYRRYLDLAPSAPDASQVGRWVAALEGRQK